MKYYQGRFKGHVRFGELLAWALGIAREAERTWKPERGAFATHLGYRLQRLSRIGQQTMTAKFGPPPWQHDRRNDDRQIVLGRTGTLDPIHHRRGLRALSRRKFYPAERAVLDWLLSPTGTQADLADRIGVSPSWVSTTKNKLLRMATETPAARPCQRHLVERFPPIEFKREGLLWQIMDDMRKSGDWGESALSQTYH